MIFFVFQFFHFLYKSVILYMPSNVLSATHIKSNLASCHILTSLLCRYRFVFVISISIQKYTHKSYLCIETVYKRPWSVVPLPRYVPYFSCRAAAGQRPQSPVQWKDFLFVCLSVRPPSGSLALQTRLVGSWAWLSGSRAWLAGYWA